MSADKIRKAAARTEPGTRWESLTGPHARLFICPEEIPDRRSRTRWKPLRSSRRSLRRTTGQAGKAGSCSPSGPAERIKLYIIIYKYIRLIRSGRPLSMQKDSGEISHARVFVRSFTSGHDCQAGKGNRSVRKINRQRDGPALECADNRYYRNMSADKIRKAAADRIRNAES